MASSGCSARLESNAAMASEINTDTAEKIRARLSLGRNSLLRKTVESPMRISPNGAPSR